MPNFNTQMTAGSAIEQAARAAAESRGHNGGGQSGDYGLSQGRSGAKALDQAEILTDTMGVDFGPYLTRITQIVRQNWYSLMPPSVYPPILKQGKLTIEFVILKDGKTTGMVVQYFVRRRGAGSGRVGEHYGVDAVSAAAEGISWAASGLAVLLFLQSSAGQR